VDFFFFRWGRGRLLTGLLVGACVWMLGAGLDGYKVGKPPTGVFATAPCYHTLRVDFVIPMWKPAPASECP